MTAECVVRCSLLVRAGARTYIGTVAEACSEGSSQVRVIGKTHGPTGPGAAIGSAPGVKQLAYPRSSSSIDARIINNELSRPALAVVAAADIKEVVAEFESVMTERVSRSNVVGGSQVLDTRLCIVVYLSVGADTQS